jgi:hypothetical protein
VSKRGVNSAYVLVEMAFLSSFPVSAMHVWLDRACCSRSLCFPVLVGIAEGIVSIFKVHWRLDMAEKVMYR